MTGRWLRVAAARLLLVLITVPAGTGPAMALPGQLSHVAQQQEQLKADIKRLAASGDGSHAQATLALTGPLAEGVKLGTEAFSVTIDGRPAPVTKVKAPGKTGRQVSALLVVDTSGSMRASDNIGRAKAAARRFVEELQPGGKAGLLAFADQPAPASVLTDKQAQLAAGIDRLKAAGETALWDAVAAAAAALSQAPGDRAVILLSDGEDNRSTNTLNEAITAAQKAHVTVYAIALDSGAQVPRGALRQLAAQTKGRYIPARGAELASLYAGLGQELYSNYVLEVEVPAGTQRERDMVVTVQVGQSRVSDQGLLLLPAAKQAARGLDQQPVPGLGRLETQQGLYLIAALMFAAVLLLRCLVAARATVSCASVSLSTRCPRPSPTTRRRRARSGPANCSARPRRWRSR
jgi:VWFA-related protein